MMKVYGNDFSKVLLHTGAIAYVSSSAAQIGAIALNDKTTSENKKYMMLQETGECVFNTALFYTVCQYVKAKTEKFFKEGVFLPLSAKDLVGDEKIQDIEKFFDDLIKKGEDVRKITKIKFELKTLKPFVTNCSAFFSAVIACNVVTPILRNWFAQYFCEK